MANTLRLQGDTSREPPQEAEPAIPNRARNSAPAGAIWVSALRDSIRWLMGVSWYSDGNGWSAAAAVVGEPGRAGEFFPAGLAVAALPKRTRKTYLSEVRSHRSRRWLN